MHYFALHIAYFFRQKNRSMGWHFHERGQPYSEIRRAAPRSPGWMWLGLADGKAIDCMMWISAACIQSGGDLSAYRGKVDGCNIGFASLRASAMSAVTRNKLKIILSINNSLCLKTSLEAEDSLFLMRGVGILCGVRAFLLAANFLFFGIFLSFIFDRQTCYCIPFC